MPLVKNLNSLSLLRPVLQSLFRSMHTYTGMYHAAGGPRRVNTYMLNNIESEKGNVICTELCRKHASNAVGMAQDPGFVQLHRGR